MNKKQNLLAIALSATFVLGGANVAEANEQAQTVAEEKQEAPINQSNSNEIINTNETEQNSVNIESAAEPKEEEKKEETPATIGEENKKVQEASLEAQEEGSTINDDQVKAVSNEVDVELSEENVGGVQKAPAEGKTEPNYSEDEAKIKDYDEKNDYKKTDLEQGDTTQYLNKNDAGEEAKDGFKFDTSNPSPTSPSLTEYGYAIVIDKKTGQRTYTLLYVTDTGRIAVKTGDKPMMEEGNKLNDGSPEVTYKPNEDGTVTDGGRGQKNYNWFVEEETLKHINDADYTVIGMKDDYDQDNPNIKFFEGDSFQVVYKVNPWPNENDKLELMELSGEYRDKVFVQGQEIKTDIKVDNIDENAKERIVGQVYNPVTGKIVPGASAYIDDDGYVHIKMPEGALKKDENGNYVVNEDSIFNTDDYKALQNLDVKFFARPRTKDEFTKIAEDGLDPGTYVGPVAGTEDINHKGENVTIDKQGIDRYDHYNLIGTLKIDLDDTRYYDQHFKDGNQDDTADITSSAVKPGEKFDVGIYEKDDPGEYDKSADDMNGAKSRGEAVGVLKMDFINKLNEGKEEKDQWRVIVDPDDISKFSIIAPASAKAGDFAAIPVEYTYTNGSKDTHWFHFVVQETDNNRPSYTVQVDYPSNEMKSPVEVDKNDKKRNPVKYTIDSDTYTDDKGNTWNVSIDEQTGVVTAKPQAKPDGETFNGGEKLQVPVTAHYQDTDETETTTAEFVLKEKSFVAPDYDAKNGKAGDELTSSPKLEEDDYNRKPFKYTLEDGSLEGTYKDDNGNEWNVTIDPDTGKVTANVPKAEEGKTIDLDGTIINVPVTAHYKDADGNEIGSKKANVQFLGSGTEGKHKYTENIPFETKVEVTDELKPGEWRYKVVNGVKQTGKNGSETKEITIKDSKVVGDPKLIDRVNPTNAIIEIGNGTTEINIEPVEKTVETDYKTKIEYDSNLEAGTVERTEGKKGTTTITTSYNKDKNKIEITEKEVVAPKDEIIRIGTKKPEPAENTTEVTKEVGTKIEYIYDDDLELGEVILGDFTPGKVETKVVQKYDPATGRITATEETVVTPGVQKIVVGRKKTENTCPVIPTPDPDQPDKPVDPGKPDKPDQPVTPDPEKPDKPQEPETPDTPDTPDKPVNPEEPGTPDKPETPETPEKPEEPGTPDKPEKPGDPGTPDKPENPDKPETPEKPNKPSDKETPDSPKENLKEEKEEIGRVNQSKDKSKNPKTGIGSVAPIFTSMGISIAGLMATRKKKEDK